MGKDIDAGADRWTNALWEETYGERPVVRDPEYEWLDELIGSNSDDEV